MRKVGRGFGIDTFVCPSPLDQGSKEGLLYVVNLRHAFHRQTASPDTLQRMIVPVTGGPEDRRLLEIVDRINRKRHSEITLVYVIEVMQSMPLDAELPLEIERGEHVLNQAEIVTSPCVDGKRGSIRVELLQARSAGAAIVDEAIEKQADTILMGATVQKRHGRVTTGETVDYVLKNAPCEVVVIRHAQSEWLDYILEQE